VTFRRILAKRLPILALLLAALWFFRGGGAREVSLIWVLPADPPTTEARVRVLDEDGAVASALSWGSDRTPAEARRAHRALLAPGAYRIQAHLRRADGTAKDVERDLQIDREDEAIQIHLE